MLTCELEERAAQLWPDSKDMQEKWVSAIKYLLMRNKWVLRGGDVTWKDSL